MWAFLINQVLSVSLGTYNRLWCIRAPPRRFYPFCLARAFSRKISALAIMVFLLSRINFIVNLKPFNFYLGGTGKGPLVDYSPFTSACGFLFTLERIGRLIAFLTVLLSRLEVLGYKNRTPHGFFNSDKFGVLLR